MSFGTGRPEIMGTGRPEISMERQLGGGILRTFFVSVPCRRGIACHVDRVHDAPATQCDPRIIAGLSAAAAASHSLLQRALAAADTGAASPPLVPADAATTHKAGRVRQEARQAAAGAACPVGGTCQLSSGSAASDVGVCAAGGDNASGSGSGSSASDNSPEDDAARKPPQAPDSAEAAAEPSADLAAGLKAEPAAAAALPELVSGAGHDALAMAEAGPMGMLFVRCRNGGISHSPDEKVDDVDVAAATAALLAYLHAEVA